ncbi:MAG TPA: hypothetical protein VML55_22125 [Planctomycetaceae bacterium]|nr:hypothetical protein [Planctomycetaceae bacterium]
MTAATHLPGFDRTAVSLEPRTTANCLDVAAMFYGRHIADMLRAWAVVAAPTCAVVYGLAWRQGFDVRAALVAVYVATLPEGVLVTLAVVPALFGRRLSLVGGLANASGRLVGLLFKTAVVRTVAAVGPALMLFSEEWLLGLVGFLLTLVPCGWLAARTGFLSERTALRSLDERLHDRRTDRLLGEQSGDLYSRACWILIYFVMLWAVVFVTVDFGWYLLAGDSPLVGRVLELAESAATSGEVRQTFADVWHVLVHDAFLQVELTATGLLAFPLTRLAWLFCYLDVRVRKDCWDMQLQFADEVVRLEGRG